MTETLGEFIHRIRKEKRITSRELADLSGVSQGYISQLETKKFKNPSLEVLEGISKALKVSKLYLLKLSGYLDETDILNLVDENKRLREALEEILKFGPVDISDYVRIIARKALEGEQHGPSTD